LALLGKQMADKIGTKVRILHAPPNHGTKCLMSTTRLMDMGIKDSPFQVVYRELDFERWLVTLDKGKKGNCG